jgi:hypothetical protein
VGICLCVWFLADRMSQGVVQMVCNHDVEGRVYQWSVFTSMDSLMLGCREFRWARKSPLTFTPTVKFIYHVMDASHWVAQ